MIRPILLFAATLILSACGGLDSPDGSKTSNSNSHSTGDSPEDVQVSATTVPVGSKLFHVAGTGSFEVPLGVTNVRVTVVGGGGGAGAPGAITTSSGSIIYSWGGGAGGAGAGGLCKSTIAVIPGQIIPLVVGAGGTGGQFNGSSYAGLNNSGASGTNSTFHNLLEASGGIGGGGGNGSYLGGSGAGGVAGAGGTCVVAGNLASAIGSSGSVGQPASSVAGTQSVYHADGGAGGLGFILQSVSCGQGATAESKSDPFTNQSRSGNAGCIFVEWGF